MAGNGPDSAERVHAESRAEWHDWLAEHHESSSAAWLVSWRTHTGRPAVGYEDAVCEALAVGWVDSKQVKIDDDRSRLYFCPRKAGSGWARPNKERIKALERYGLMTEAGRRVVRAAQVDGSWAMLDDVENLVVPADLSRAFDRFPGSRDLWDEFPRSARRGMLAWIVQAKRPETRANRIEETAAAAAKGQRAH